MSQKNKIKHFKKPKAKIDGISAPKLQSILFEGKRNPDYCSDYYKSDDLMKIYKLFVHSPKLWQANVVYDLEPKDKLHFVFGTDFRHIYTYIAQEPFQLTCGELSEHEELPPDYTPHKARAVNKGDTILIRRDTRDEDLKVDVQILSAGLFQDSSEDFRSFRVDTSDIGSFRKFLKLVDDDGVEESFI